MSEQREEARTKKRLDKVAKAAATKRAIDAAALDSLVRGGKLKAGNDPSWNIEWISTGIPQLDKVLGGGIPRKRITVLLGEYSCMAPETLIDTNVGRLSIKEIVDNRLAVKVWSFNSQTEKWSLKPVTRWWKQPQYSELVKLGSLQLTPGHEIWTLGGYVPAGELVRLDRNCDILLATPKTLIGGYHERDLQSLQSRCNRRLSQGELFSNRDVSSLCRLWSGEEEDTPSTVLRMRDEMAAGEYSRLRRGVATTRSPSQATTFLHGEDEGSSQSELGTTKESWETGCYRETKDGSQESATLEIGRLWPSRFSETKETIRCLGGSLDQRIVGEDRTFFSALGIQDRYCTSELENCYRSRELAQSFEDSMVSRQWVDTSSFLQQNGGGLVGGVSSDGYVYDLTVEDNHNFIANGILVSNSAKTFLVQMLIKQAIAQGLKAAYIDTERSYDPAWWAQCGIPLEKILVSQPPTGEAAVDVLLALVKANVDVVAMDSIAALIPMEETGDDASAENKNIASQARLIAKMMRMLMGVEESNSAIVMTNQVREVIGGPVAGVQMPGGKAAKHYTSIILRTRREDWIKEGEEKVGFQLKVIAQKNKAAQPWGECRLPFRFRGELDMVSLLVDQALEIGLVEQKGPWFYLRMEDVDPEPQQGRNKLIELLSNDEALQERVRAAIG